MIGMRMSVVLLVGVPLPDGDGTGLGDAVGLGGGAGVALGASVGAGEGVGDGAVTVNVVIPRSPSSSSELHDVQRIS